MRRWIVVLGVLALVLGTYSVGFAVTRAKAPEQDAAGTIQQAGSLPSWEDLSAMHEAMAAMPAEQTAAMHRAMMNMAPEQMVRLCQAHLQALEGGNKPTK